MESGLGAMAGRRWCVSQHCATSESGLGAGVGREWEMGAEAEAE